MDWIKQNIFRPLLEVDLRVLGITRILLGIVCFFDIARRMPYIETFYTDNGLITTEFLANLNRFGTKAFSLLRDNFTGIYFSESIAVTIFFYLALLFSIFFIVGYKTKFSHFMVAVMVISMHNRNIILENGGDLVLNNLLILTLFLPLGGALSIDALKKSLSRYNDSTPKSLNDGNFTYQGPPRSYWGLAYFAVLLQYSIIYIFNYLNKDGSTWEQGTSLYYLYQLDLFLTPLGKFIGANGLMPIEMSKLLTEITMYMELIVPFLILCPFFYVWTRRISYITMFGFHVIIGISLWIGLFSWTMIAGLTLLLTARDINLLKMVFNRLSPGPYIVFYDSDCGFCHQVCRILRRMDIFQRFIWAGNDWQDQKPDSLKSLADKTIVLWNQESNQVYTRHEAFGKMIQSLPLGFLVSWIFFVPGIGHLFGFVYDKVAGNRTKISTSLGYKACDISSGHIDIYPEELESIPYIKKYYYWGIESARTIVVGVLIVASVNYSIGANDGLKDWLKEEGYKASDYQIQNRFIKNNLRKITKSTRMVQKWNMFSPTTPRSNKWIVLKATMDDGEVIDLMTGKPPIMDRLDYEIYRESIYYDQFIRKYLTRIIKNNYKRYRDPFKKAVLSEDNPLSLGDGRLVKSIELWKIHKSVPKPGSTLERKVTKRKISLNTSSNRKIKNTKIKSKPKTKPKNFLKKK